MKVIGLFFLFSTCICQTLHAQKNNEEEIRRLEVEWTKLLNQGDTTALLRIWTRDYVVNNPNGKISGVADIVATIRNGQKFPEVERNIEKITFNHNLAIVMGSELAAGSTQQGKVKRRFTNVWIRGKQGWQLAARQSTNTTL